MTCFMHNSSNTYDNVSKWWVIGICLRKWRDSMFPNKSSALISKMNIRTYFHACYDSLISLKWTPRFLLSIHLSTQIKCYLTKRQHKPFSTLCGWASSDLTCPCDLWWPLCAARWHSGMAALSSGTGLSSPYYSSKICFPLQWRREDLQWGEWHPHKAEWCEATQRLLVLEHRTEVRVLSCGYLYISLKSIWLHLSIYTNSCLCYVPWLHTILL